MNVLDLFSGIGGFSLGLERAGMRTVAFCEIDPFCRRVLAKHWPDVPCYPDIRELSGSDLNADGIFPSVICGGFPCQDISLAGQPFSAAGAGKAGDDERHLWPAWFSLISECRPAIVYGEQVEAAIGWGWLDAVYTDLEAEGYACGAAILPACSVGAPHIRNRLWFVADTDGGDASTEGLQRGGEHGQRPQNRGAGSLADSQRNGWREGSENSPRRNEGIEQERTWRGFADHSGGSLGIAPSVGWSRIGAQSAHSESGQASQNVLADSERYAGRTIQPKRRPQGRVTDGWSCAEFIECSDRKARPIEPGSFPLAHGIQRRTSKLRAYGNAIVPQVAAEFIGASMRETF